MTPAKPANAPRRLIFVLSWCEGESYADYACLGMRENFSTGEIGFRRTYLRSVIDRVEADDMIVRVVADNATLEDVTCRQVRRSQFCPRIAHHPERNREHLCIGIFVDGCLSPHFGAHHSTVDVSFFPTRRGGAEELRIRKDGSSMIRRIGPS